jgi:hypothetical protein
VPLFFWRRHPNIAALMVVSTAIHGAGEEQRARIEREIFHAGIQPDEEHEGELARSRWLEEHRAERSFPCGIVPEPRSDRAADSMPARPDIAVPDVMEEPGPDRAADLLPSEPGWGMPESGVYAPQSAPERPDAEDEPEIDEIRPMSVVAAVLPEDLVFIREFGADEGEVEEVGRRPRRAIQAVDVVDETGVHVPEPIDETFEPPKLAWTVLSWANQGTPDEDRFAFRSSWTAWQAARRLLEARRG